MFLGVSLFFLALSKDEKLAGLFGLALLIDYITKDSLPTKINQNQIPNNTVKALGAAVLAFGIFILVTLAVSFILQSTAFLQGDIRSEGLQSIIRHGFAATGLDPDQPILANSKLLTYFEYAVVIAIIETRLIIRLMVTLANLFGVSLERFSAKLAGIYGFVAWLFVMFHINVKDVTDNTALTMTFIFAIISFELARRFKEMESATDLHIINNFVFIFKNMGF